MAGGKVDRELAEWLVVALILFALFVEFLLHKLEHWVAHRHPQLQAVLRNLYRELMILGAVSFGFILYLFIAPVVTKDTQLTVEVAHIFIFIFAVFHTVVVMVTIHISLRLSNRWIDLEHMDLAKYLAKKDSYRKLSDRLEKHSGACWRWFSWWFPKPSRLFRYWKLHEIMTFHDTRFQFIYFRNLPPDFQFATFLRKIKSATFIELVEIHWTHFAFFLAIVLLDLIRAYAKFTKKHIASLKHFEPAFLIADSVLNVVFTALLAAKIRRVYWKMTKNPATYYDTVDRRTIEEEYLIAEEEARMEAENSNRRSQDTVHPRNSEQRSSKSYKKKHHAGGILTQQPIYANMAYVPSGLDKPHGVVDSETAQRHSIDLRKTGSIDRPTAQISSNRPGPYLPDVLSEGRISEQGMERRSLEMSMALPTSELAERTVNSSEIVVNEKKSAYVAVDSNFLDERAEELERMQRSMSEKSTRRAEAIRRIRERQKPTASIAKNALDLEAAQLAQPGRRYPRWVVKLIPRLGRVASPAEKLFWFGSHKFFMWCVEWVLFFSTVNLAGTIAKLAFEAKELYGSVEKKKNAASAAKFVIRAVAATGKSSTKTESLLTKADKEMNIVLLGVALGVAVLALIYVLMRIAGIMKKYIFVLNNANMLPESMTIQAIQTVGLKNFLYGDSEDEMEEDYIDVDESESQLQRQNLSSFLGTEAEKGYMPGVTSRPVLDSEASSTPIIE